MAKEPLEHYGKQINESILGSLLGLMFAPKLKRTFSKIYKETEADPELKAALIDYAKQSQNVKQIIKSICTRHPHLSNCKKKSRHTR